ncbi:DUF5047 domain-containing protein [Streptomyces sp. NPDC044948]|uniref:DUF5047 domain-containing protein n=1 Tax=Streptomyces sp. NPDC044948 TaxID=3157092 RepID=UPI003410EE8E
MLDLSAEALAIVQRSFVMEIRVSSWRGGELLADDLPVSEGSETRDRSVAVPERVALSVPRRDRGVVWDPGADVDHPLAAYGQQIRVDYGVHLGRAGVEWINRGSFLITEASADGDTVSVTAQGLLTLIDEAKFVAPFQPSGTLTSTVRSLVEPALTVSVDGALVDRAVPVGMQWDSDRLAALNEVLDAWAADAYVTEDGVLQVGPLDDTGTPVLELTDGQGGTVIRWQGSTSRDGAFNAVICQGEDADGNQVQGAAYDYELASPYRLGGPFNALPVPKVINSPLMRTVDQCRKAAATTLARLRRTASRRLIVSMVPHPGLMLGDIVSVTGQGLTAAPCAIETLSLPYSPGEQTLTVRVL